MNDRDFLRLAMPECPHCAKLLFLPVGPQIVRRPCHSCGSCQRITNISCPCGVSASLGLDHSPTYLAPPAPITSLTVFSWLR